MGDTIKEVVKTEFTAEELEAMKKKLVDGKQIYDETMRLKDLVYQKLALE